MASITLVAPRIMIESVPTERAPTPRADLPGRGNRRPKN